MRSRSWRSPLYGIAGCGLVVVLIVAVLAAAGVIQGGPSRATRLGLSRGSPATTVVPGVVNAEAPVTASTDGRAAAAPGAATLGSARGHEAASAPTTVPSFPCDGLVDDMAAGWDAALWLVQISGNSDSFHIGHLMPDGSYRGYALPNGARLTDEGNVTFSGDGGVWFTEFQADRIGRLDPATGHVSEYPLARFSGPYGIVPGVDGGVWFVETTSKRIAHMAPGGKLTEYSPSAGNSDLQNLALDTQGNVWFILDHPNKIGRLSTAGQITEYDVPDADPQGGQLGPPVWITAHPNGSMYFLTSSHGVGRIDQDGTITVKALHEAADDDTHRGEPTDSDRPNYVRIVAGPDGDLWFTARLVVGTGTEVERITPDLADRQILDTNSALLTVGEPITSAAGAVWTPLESGPLQRFDPSGAVSTVPVCR